MTYHLRREPQSAHFPGGTVYQCDWLYRWLVLVRVSDILGSLSKYNDDDNFKKQ